MVAHDKQSPVGNCCDNQQGCFIITWSWHLQIISFPHPLIPCSCVTSQGKETIWPFWNLLSHGGLAWSVNMGSWEGGGRGRPIKHKMFRPCHVGLWRQMASPAAAPGAGCCEGDPGLTVHRNQILAIKSCLSKTFQQQQFDYTLDQRKETEKSTIH